MESETILTYFDSPERLDTPQIVEAHNVLSQDVIIGQMLEGYTEIALILNSHRQILQANTSAKEVLQASDMLQVLGKRFGEAIGCIHHGDMPGGCGTSHFCKECGAAKAIKKRNESKQVAAEECRITSVSGGKEIHYDLWVQATPFIYNGLEYTLVAAKDISAEKRKEALEQIFFHDVLNISGTIKGVARLLPETENENDRFELYRILLDSSQQMINEINHQKELSSAENGTLEVEMEAVSINKLLKKTYDIYRNHEISKGKNFQIEYPAVDIIFKTDESLVIRSLGNLIKNAFEASATQDPVKLYTEYFNDRIEIKVFNNGVIPLPAQRQLFQRSFTTKQKRGRGLGLYSVKLIVEQYLNGKTHFISDANAKTVFSISLPVNG